MTDRKLSASAVALPIVYFGMQVVLAPFFPGYDFLHNPTSLLGISGSPTAPWFNALALFCGLLAMTASLGFWRMLNGNGGHVSVAAMVSLILVGVGCGNIWAGLFPLPDERHGANPFNLAFDAVPAALAFAAWFTAALRPLRTYLSINLGIWIMMKAIFAELTLIDPNSISGLLQRFAAATIFLPIGFAGWVQILDARRKITDQGVVG